jgi:hypothetical protein
MNSSGHETHDERFELVEKTGRCADFARTEALADSYLDGGMLVLV